MTTKELILTPEDLRRFNLSNCNFDRLTPFLIEAQELDLCDLLGDCLYEKVICEPGNYADLLNEFKYECHENMKRHPGLKIVVAHLAYAKYVLRGSNVDTPHGMVQKLNTDSVPVPASELRSIYNEHNKIARTYWGRVINYLSTVSDEDKYECFDFSKCPPCGCNTKRSRSLIRKAVTFKAITKNEKSNNNGGCSNCNEYGCMCSKNN